MARLASLFALEEQARSAEMRRRSSALDAANHATAEGCEAWREASGSGRSALSRGDSAAYAVAEVSGALGEVYARGWAANAKMREADLAIAREEYLATRQELEQMKHLLARQNVIAESKADREAQAGMDDRYLARAMWLKKRGQVE